jgi:hypothetical protein
LQPNSFLLIDLHVASTSTRMLVPLESISCALPILQALCFHIHICNGGTRYPLPDQSPAFPGHAWRSLGNRFDRRYRFNENCLERFRKSSPILNPAPWPRFAFFSTDWRASRPQGHRLSFNEPIASLSTWEYALASLTPTLLKPSFREAGIISVIAGLLGSGRGGTHVSRQQSHRSAPL